MIIIPAIDLKDGKVVRLVQGRFDNITTYPDDPISTALRWESLGAQWLHVVDLDGAQRGTIKNFDVIVKIANHVKIPVQMGGGLREQSDIDSLLQNGISRVILGTKAIEDRDFLKGNIKRWSNRIVVSLDCSKEMVAKRGWSSTSNLKATEFAKELQDLGLQCLIYTDIARDGTLKGPNFQGVQDMLASIQIPLIASGGVSKIEDIKKLSEYESQGLQGVIIGKALYEGKIDFLEALKICLQKE